MTFVGTVLPEPVLLGSAFPFLRRRRGIVALDPTLPPRQCLPTPSLATATDPRSGRASATVRKVALLL